jgi:hypothetical protein
MQIRHFNTMFNAHQVEDVILFIFKISKFIVFIFKKFQSSKLIMCSIFFHVIVFCKLL